MSVLLLGQSWLIVVSGLAGTPRHAAQFDEQSAMLITAARTRLGMRDERIVRVSDNTTPAATVEGITRVLSGVADRAQPQDVVTIVLIGHGSAASGPPRFNVRGPDLTADQMARLLERFPTQQLVVVNASSASGPWVEALAGPRRVIITATRSATERDETTFMRHFAASFGSEEGDADKDGRVSILEAFEFARQGVTRHYQSLRRLRTENPLLDDNGDGRGSLMPSATGEGSCAAAVFLDAPAANADSGLAVLLGRRDSLQRALGELQSRRGAAPDTAAHSREVERLLLEIARNGAEIRARQAARTP